MKKTQKKAMEKKALSVSLSMALMLGGTAPVQAADLFSDQTAEESTSMELYPEENTAEESNTADFAADETENGAEDFSAGQEDQADEFSAGDEDSSKGRCGRSTVCFPCDKYSDRSSDRRNRGRRNL